MCYFYVVINYELKEYISSTGKSYFRAWFEKLGATAAAKVTAALHKMERGNFASTKFLGSGVWEFKIDTGPGYRLYFGKVGKNVVLLLAGGIKRGQNKDIQLAVDLLDEHNKGVLH
jgi:putative addiction module killer protein